MFQNCAYETTLRLLATQGPSTVVNIDVDCTHLGQDTGGFVWVVESFGTGAGATDALQVFASYDDGVTYTNAGADFDRTITADGFTYISLDGPLPRCLRLQSTRNALTTMQIGVRIYTTSFYVP